MTAAWVSCVLLQLVELAVPARGRHPHAPAFRSRYRKVFLIRSRKTQKADVTHHGITSTAACSRGTRGLLIRCYLVAVLGAHLGHGVSNTAYRLCM
jgi:hypothetical protein